MRYRTLVIINIHLARGDQGEIDKARVATHMLLYLIKE